MKLVGAEVGGALGGLGVSPVTKAAAHSGPPATY